MSNLPGKQVEQPPDLDQSKDSLLSLDFSTLSDKSVPTPIGEWHASVLIEKDPLNKYLRHADKTLITKRESGNNNLISEEVRHGDSLVTQSIHSISSCCYL